MKFNSKNSFKSLDTISSSGKDYKIFNLKNAEKNGLQGISKLPKSLKVLGTLFLIYLAYKIAFSSVNESEKIKKPVNFFDTFLFQFINPKGVMVAMIAVSTFIDVQNNYFRDASIVIITYFFVAVFSVSSWCLLGKYLRKFATSKNFIKKFNYTMSFLLIVCVIMFYV